MLCYGLLITVTWLLPFLPTFPMDDESLTLLTWDGYRALLEESAVTYWGSLAIWIAIAISLWFFWRPARLLLLIFSIVSVVLSGLGGIRISLPLDGVVAYIAVLLNGAILIGAYLPPMSKEFGSAGRDATS